MYIYIYIFSHLYENSILPKDTSVDWDQNAELLVSGPAALSPEVSTWDISPFILST